jgi:hypothetical protein
VDVAIFVLALAPIVVLVVLGTLIDLGSSNRAQKERKIRAENAELGQVVQQVTARSRNSQP